MYLSAPIQKLYPGTALEITQGFCEIRMPLSPEHLHAAGAMHGSVYFRLLDDSAFFAANSLVEEVFVLTSQFTIQLIRPHSEGELIARGNVITETRGSIIAESKLFNRDEKLIAMGSGTFKKSKIPLTEDIGYHE